MNSYAITEDELEELIRASAQNQYQFIAQKLKEIRKTRTPLVPVEQLRRAFHNSFGIRDDDADPQATRDY